MNGLRHVTTPYVFLTDADTIVPARDYDLGFLLAEIENGADAVGGIPSSNLRSGGLLPHIRATVKFPMIIAKRTFQQILGGAPFLISGACGLFRTEVLREVGLSDRTKVEDLDLTWTLVERGYKVRQSSFCVVYPQECHTLREEWLRWRRWIWATPFVCACTGACCSAGSGYSACSRCCRRRAWDLHISRHLGAPVSAHGPRRAASSSFPHSGSFAYRPRNNQRVPPRKAWLVIMAPLAILYVLLSYAVWLTHGIRGLITGREFSRDKPTRYAYVVA